MSDDSESAAPENASQSPVKRKLLRTKRLLVDSLGKLATWSEVSPKEAKSHLVQALAGVLVTALIGLVLFFMSGMNSVVADLFPFGPQGKPSNDVVQNTPQQSSDAGLQIVDVAFIETDSLPQIDIMLRNTGDQVAFLKEARFHVDEIWGIEWYSAGAGFSPTGNYDVELATIGAPYEHPVRISQSVESNNVDRFTFTISLDEPLNPFREFVFLMSIELVYDEDDKTISTGDLLYMFGHPSRFNTFQNMTSIGSTRNFVIAISEIDAKRNERLDVLIDSLD